MKKKAVSKLLVNWVASLVSVMLLLSMMALPALAVMAANTVNSRAIINGQVRTPDLAGDAVTSAKIKNGQVKRADIAVGAIVSGRIADGAVTTAKIRNGHVRTADIAAGAVRSGKIANDAITSAKIRNGSITNEEIAPGLNADKLDGKHASGFVGNSGPQSIDGTVTAKSFSYDTTKTDYLTVPAAAFRPWRDSDDAAYNSGNYNYMWAVGAAPGSFVAPVNLPSGAVITKFEQIAYDGTADYASTVRLYKYTRSQASALIAITSSGLANAPNAWQTYEDPNPDATPIDNNENQYLLLLSLAGLAESATAFERVIITYDYTSPGS